MSGFFDRLAHGRREALEDRREALEERREALEERRELGRRGRRHDSDEYEDDEGDFGRFGHRGRHHHGEGGLLGRRSPQPYDSYAAPSQPPPQFQGQGQGFGQGQGQGQGYGGHGYAPPAGPPPSARGPTGLGGLDRGDFASDAEIERMISSGEFSEKRGGQGYGPGQGYGEQGNERGRYGAPQGPPPGQQPHQQYGSGGGYGGPPGQQPHQQGGTGGPPGQQPHQQYGSGGPPGQQPHQQGYGSGGGYGPPQTQGRPQHDAPQGPPPGYGRGQGNAPAGGFSAARNDEGQHGEAASYYAQQGGPGQGDRYAHLADMAHEHADDPELYRRATQGLHEKIQAQSGQQARDEDYKAHADTHQKAYGGDDHGPMDTGAIGIAAAMEAFKQIAAGGKTGGAVPAAGATAAAGAGAGASRGMQDKLMALAMSQAGKLFDKKNAGSSGNKTQDKAQAMQSAAATAMQLFSQYKTKGALDSGDMQKVMGLAMTLF